MPIHSCERCGYSLELPEGNRLNCGCHLATFIDNRPKQRIPAVGKVGTELAAIIPRIFRKSKKCGCHEYANLMDSWGIDGCIQRYDEIVATLVKRANRQWFLRMFPDSSKEAKAKQWLDQAIENALRALKASRPDNGDWYVAITTAPRKDCTLIQCIASMRKAGWEPTIFAEPGSTATDAETIWNESRKGCWHNWLASARYALDNSNAKIILTVQDDSLFHPDSRAFMEASRWPSKDVGFVSLYTPKHYSFAAGGKLRPPGIYRIRTTSLWGACALVWPRDVLAKVIEHPIARQWTGARPRSGNKAVIQKRRDNPHLIANSDTAIGRILNKMGRTMWFVDPSPVSHIAVHSAIGHGSNTGRRNCYRCADHSIPLEAQVRP
jgi:hypothetical protein